MDVDVECVLALNLLLKESSIISHKGICQSIILSGQVILDNAGMKGVKFNIMYVCLKVFDVTWDFSFSRTIYLCYVVSIFCKLHLEKYRNWNTQLSCNHRITEC